MKKTIIAVLIVLLILILTIPLVIPMINRIANPNERLINFDLLSPIGEHIMSYSQLYSYMEVSLERQGYLTFRAQVKHDSMGFPQKILFCKYSMHDKDIYYLTLISGTDNKAQGIQYKVENWGGVEISIPNNTFDSHRDTIYYKDTQGEYRICIGTRKTWLDYINKGSSIKKSNLDL